MNLRKKSDKIQNWLKNIFTKPADLMAHLAQQRDKKSSSLKIYMKNENVYKNLPARLGLNLGNFCEKSCCCIQ